MTPGLLLLILLSAASFFLWQVVRFLEDRRMAKKQKWFIKDLVDGHSEDEDNLN